MNELKIFNNPDFGDIRTMMIEGEPWFVGKDVCRALGYADTYSGVRKNVDAEDKRGCPVGSTSGTQEMIVINESGLYSLIFGSKLESAKKFKKWVTSEVLPSIRKTGSYSNQLPKNPMELLELHYEAIRHVDNKVDALAEDLEQFKQELPLFGTDEDKIVTAVRRKGTECLGGKGSNAYKDKSLRARVYRDIHGELRRQFSVTTYKAIKRNQCDTAIAIINSYQLPYALAEEVYYKNAQINLWEDEAND